MKVYDFSNRDLTALPIIKESSPFTYILNNNCISVIDTIPFTCQKLLLKSNKITYINKKLSSDIQLLYLDLSYNRIISLEGVSKLEKLSELDLSNNYITDEQLQYITQLRNLKILNLSNNNIKTDCFIDTISNIKSIEKLILNYNHIESITFNKECSNLKYLELEANKIKSISISNNNLLPNLTYINLNQNKLDTLNSLLYYLPSIEYISLNENDISILQTFSIKNNMKNHLKYFQIRSNLLSNIILNNNYKNCELFDFSYNNISEFHFTDSKFNIKTLLLTNNKLKTVVIEGSNNLEGITEVDLSYNLLTKYLFLHHFTNIQKLNLSFNQLQNLDELISILKKLNQLRELNLIENDFNRKYYNIDVVPTELFNSIDDYFNNPLVKNNNTNNLIIYRAIVIFNLSINLTYLDSVNISVKEKTNSENNSKKKINENKNLKHIINYNFNTTKTDNQNTLKESYHSTITDNNISKIQSNASKILSRNTYNTIDIKDKDYKSFVKELQTPEGQFLSNTQTDVYNHNSSYISSFRYEMNTEESFDDNDNVVYTNLIKTFSNISNKNGFIAFDSFEELLNELSDNYQIKSYLDDISTQIKSIINNSIIPNKFHIKELKKILRQKKYEQMFDIIQKSITNTENNNNTINKESTNKDSTNKEFKSITNDNIKNKPKNIAVKTDYSFVNKNKRDYSILNTLLIKSPLLSIINQQKNKEEKKEIVKKKTNKNDIKCFNFLFQSSSELINRPDLNNQKFLKDLIYFINHISFPISYKDSNQSYIISISNNEKEYKFIKAFISNYNILNFTLEKWYCFSYYNQIFSDYNSNEFLFENKIIFFFTFYNEIIDNFFNDIYQLQDCFLLIEENPLNLLNNNTQSNKIVMLGMLTKKYNEQNQLIDNIVYNQSDDKFYFKNPFDWFSDNKSNKNILIPIYILNIYNN